MTNKEKLLAYVETLTPEQMEKVFTHPLFPMLMETFRAGRKEAQKGAVLNK